MRTCNACGRPLGKLAAKCMYCGAVAADAPKPVEVRKPILVTCPGCVRKVRVAPEAIGSCTYCAIKFVAPADASGSPRLGPLDPAATVASRAHVDRAFGNAGNRVWSTARDFLAARAELGEVVEGEAEAIAAALDPITRSTSSEELWVPLAADDAAVLVSRVLFGVTDCGVFREGPHTMLLVALGSKARAELDALERGAVNLLGFASQQAFNVGFRARRDSDKVKTMARVQVRLELEPQDGGHRLVHLGNQVDQDQPTHLTPAQRHEIAGRVANSRPTFASYFLTGALFGTSCRGGTAFSLTKEAIAHRLEALGCASPELVDALCIRPPPPFPMR